MDCTGKVTLFAEERKNKEGKPFLTFSASILGGTKEDGYIHKSMKCSFVKENFPEERLNKVFKAGYHYTVNITKGFFTPEEVETKDGKKVYFRLYIVECDKPGEGAKTNSASSSDSADW